MSTADTPDTAKLPCPDPECGGEMRPPYMPSDLHDLECRECMMQIFDEEQYARLHEQAARSASLERELHEARERARLFEGLPEPDEFGWWDGREVPVRLEGSGESWFVNVYNWTGSPVDYETAKWKTVAEGTLAECLTALRTALASHSVEEDTDE